MTFAPSEQAALDAAIRKIVNDLIGGTGLAAANPEQVLHYMPEPMVHDDLATGRLKQLNLPDWPGGAYALHAIHRTDSPPKPAAAWLIQYFASQSA